MMTTPRFVSLTALAASLFIIILTITQANGLTESSQTGVSTLVCSQSVGQNNCDPEALTVHATLLR